MPEHLFGTVTVQEHGIAATLRSRGELDVSALSYAADAVAERLKGAAWLRECDARGLNEAQFALALESGALERFSLPDGPLMRILLFRRPAAEAVVLVVARQDVAETCSAATLVHELERLYLERLGDRPSPVPDLTVADTGCVRLYRWAGGSRTSVHAALSFD